MATGMKRATLAGHISGIKVCAISPDGSFVTAARGQDGQDLGRGDGQGAGHPRRPHLVGQRLRDQPRWLLRRHGERRPHLQNLGRGDGEGAGEPRGPARSDACAISPDGSFVVTASGDHTCRIWDAATGKERASLPTLGRSRCVALHPWQPFAACGDGGGGVYLIDLVGIDYGPVIVTAVDLGTGAGPALRCPKCLRLHPLDDSWLGAVIPCPTPDCGLSLRVNPFVTVTAADTGPRPPPTARRWEP